MKHGVIPANLGLSMNMSDNVIVPRHNIRHIVHTVLCNSFGFGGNDSSILLTTERQAKEWQENFTQPDIEEKASIETVDDSNWKEYIPVLVGRRLTPQMRSLLIAAKQAIEQSGIDVPDAIITGTDWGCIHNSVQLLQQLTTEGETSLSPTLFMQSTHNTPSSLVAIQTCNHGYNATYSHGSASMNHAMLDAMMQLQLSHIRSALVLGFEEYDATWCEMTDKAQQSYQPLAKAVILQRHD